MSRPEPVPFQFHIADLLKLTSLAALACALGEYFGWVYVLTAVLNPFSLLIYFAFYLERTQDMKGG